MEKYRKATTSLTTPTISNVLTAPGEAVLAPLSHALNSNQDPFSALARPLSSMEYFLLNHCMSTMIMFFFSGVWEENPRS